MKNTPAYFEFKISETKVNRTNFIYEVLLSIFLRAICNLTFIPMFEISILKNFLIRLSL